MKCKRCGSTTETLAQPIGECADVFACMRRQRSSDPKAMDGGRCCRAFIGHEASCPTRCVLPDCVYIGGNEDASKCNSGRCPRHSACVCDDVRDDIAAECPLHPFVAQRSNEVPPKRPLLEIFEEQRRLDAQGPFPEGTPRADGGRLSDEERALLYFSSRQSEAIGSLVNDFAYVRRAAIREERLRVEALAAVHLDKTSPLSEHASKDLRALLTQVEAENARLKARIAELEADAAVEDECSEYEHKEALARRDATDARLRELLGPCWNHMWGPCLERLGGDIDALKNEIAKTTRFDAAPGTKSE